MNGNASINGGNGLDKDFAKGMDGDELIELMHPGVPEIAEAPCIVRCGACADAEPAMHGHLLGVVESAVEASRARSPATASHVVNRGEGNVDVEIDCPLLYEPGRRAEGPAIPATVLDFAANQMVRSAVDMDPLDLRRLFRSRHRPLPGARREAAPPVPRARLRRHGQRRARNLNRGHVQGHTRVVTPIAWSDGRSPRRAAGAARTTALRQRRRAANLPDYANL